MSDHHHQDEIALYGECITCSTRVLPKTEPTPEPPPPPASLFDGDTTALANDVAHARAGKARHDDPLTSKQAAHNAAVHSGTQRAVVLAAFARADDGLTGDQLCEHLGDRLGSSWRSRMAELRDDYTPALLERTGETRETRSGDQGDVHRITDAGRAVLANLTPAPRKDA